ncbi:Uncharacterised protein [Mycobacteroides abscessus]|nr:Uncharacterised protein [Mycobacteroides abscessus]
MQQPHPALRLLRRAARLDELVLEPRPLARAQHRDLDQPLAARLALDRREQHGLAAPGRAELDRDLVHAALDVQARADVRLPEDAPAHREQVRQPAARDRLDVRDLDRAQELVVGVEDARLGVEEEQRDGGERPALGPGHRHQAAPSQSRIARTRRSGCERFGQCPTESMTTRSLPGRCSCT